MATYATLVELKTYLRITNTTDDAQLTDSLESASRAVDHICGRKFDADTNATARVFWPRDRCIVLTDDFYTITGLAIATDSGDGTYTNTLTAAQYQLEPFNGVSDGEAGWPFYRIRAINGRWPFNARPSVQVTAKWGWAAVPGPVKQGTVYLAEEIFKMKESPFGIASDSQFGPIRMRTNPRVLQMLAPYMTSVVMVA